MLRRFLLFLTATIFAVAAWAQSDDFTDLGLCDYNRPAYRLANQNKKAAWADSLAIQVCQGIDTTAYRVWGAYGDSEQFMEFKTHVDASGRTVVTVPQQECTGMSYTGSGLAVPVQLSTVDVWVNAMRQAKDSTYTEQELQDFIDNYPSYYDETEGKFIMNNVYWLPAGQKYAFMYFALDKEYVELQGWEFQDCRINVTRPLFTDTPSAGLEVDVELQNSSECRLIAKAYPADGMTPQTMDEMRNTLLNEEQGTTVITESGHVRLPLNKLTDGRQYVLYAIWKNKDGQYRTNHNGFVTSYATYTYQYTAPEQGWNSIGWGRYTDGIVRDMIDLTSVTPVAYSVDVEIEESTTRPGLYRVIDPYAKLAEMMNPNEVSYASASMIIDATDPKKVYIQRGETGLTVTEYDEDGYPYKVKLGFTSAGYQAATAGIQTDAYGTLTDGVVTFPRPDLSLTDGPWALCGLKGDEICAANRDGDFRLELPSQDKVAQTLPEGLTAEKWAMTYALGGQFVGVAIQDKTLWITGVVSQLPDCAIKGTIDGDEVVFDKEQFLGVYDSGYMTFDINFMPLYFNPAPTGYDDAYQFMDKLVMKYDADARVLTCNDNEGFLTNAGTESIMFLGMYQDVRLFYQANIGTPAVPDAPYALKVTEKSEDRWDTAGFASFAFVLPYTADNGDLLDINNLYYELFVDDDEPVVFDPETYTSLTEPMTLVPATLSNQDFQASANNRSITLWFSGYDRIGVRSVYMVDGVTHRSAIVYNDGTTSGLQDLNVQNLDENAIYYDLTGRRIANPHDGIFIQVQNGKATKIVK